MKSKQYIESGDLELYALGLLSESKCKELELYASQDQNIREELEAIENMFNQVGTQQIVKAPLSKADIFSAINQSNNITSPTSNEDSVSKNTPTKANKISLNKYLFAGLITVFLAKGAIIGFLLYQNSQTNQKMDHIHQEIQSLQNDKKDIVQAKEKIERDYQILRSLAKQSITLKGTEQTASSIAVVHWDAEKKSIFIDLMNLSTPPSGKQYQLWAIVDGKPVDAGVIDSNWNEGLLQEMNFIENPQAFAVTLEVAGGSKEPTMDQMVVIGYV